MSLRELFVDVFVTRRASFRSDVRGAGFVRLFLERSAGGGICFCERTVIPVEAYSQQPEDGKSEQRRSNQPRCTGAKARFPRRHSPSRVPRFAEIPMGASIPRRFGRRTSRTSWFISRRSKETMPACSIKLPGPEGANPGDARLKPRYKVPKLGLSDGKIHRYKRSYPRNSR